MRRVSHFAGLRPPRGPRSVVLIVDEPLIAPTVASLCARVGAALGSGVDLVTCDVGAITDPDAGVVDAIARLQLTARLAGGSVRLRRASGQLRGLLDLAGLRQVVPCVTGTRDGAR